MRSKHWRMIFSEAILTLALTFGNTDAATVTAAAAKTQPIVIAYAATESDQIHLTITGISFLGAAGSQTKVFLGSNPTPLQITTLTNASLTVLLPTGTPPGSYLLTISTTNPAQADEFWVTIGAIGPKGESGDPGPQGVQGPVGLTGPAGPIGPQGPKGDKGDSGATGPSGPQGPAGATGAVGPQGPVGSTGPAGAQGPPGADGATGALGPKGDKGDPGQVGAVGPVGPGFVFQGQWSNGTTYDLNDIVTFMGSTYVAVAAHTAQQPDQSTEWELFSAGGAVGTQGPTGPPGPTGPQGPTGASGATGPQGLMGPQGPIGATGATGAQGAIGPAGLQGTQGLQGPAGPAGPSGRGAVDVTGQLSPVVWDLLSNVSVVNSQGLTSPISTSTSAVGFRQVLYITSGFPLRFQGDNCNGDVGYAAGSTLTYLKSAEAVIENDGANAPVLNTNLTLAIFRYSTTVTPATVTTQRVRLGNGDCGEQNITGTMLRLDRMAPVTLLNAFVPR